MHCNNNHLSSVEIKNNLNFIYAQKDYELMLYFSFFSREICKNKIIIHSSSFKKKQVLNLFKDLAINR